MDYLRFFWFKEIWQISKRIICKSNKILVNIEKKKKQFFIITLANVSNEQLNCSNDANLYGFWVRAMAISILRCVVLSNSYHFV